MTITYKSKKKKKNLLPSAPWCLTAVFGMGTGVTTHDIGATREIVLQKFYKTTKFIYLFSNCENKYDHNLSLSND